MFTKDNIKGFIMKKSMISISILASIVSFADSYVIVVDEESSYKIAETFTEEVVTTEWANEGGLINCISLPLNADYYKGISFQQESTCDQKQIRHENTYSVSSSGQKTLVSSIEEEKIIEVKSTDSATGTYLASSCSDIVDHQGKAGNKTYETTKGSVFCDMDYKDGSGYERTHIYKPDKALIGGCTHWRSKIAEFCSNYTENLSFTLNKTNNAYMEFTTYNYSGTPYNANTSTITVDGINVVYNLMSPVKHEVNLSSKSNGSKTMTIRFSHDANGNGKDNNMGVKEIYLYEK